MTEQFWRKQIPSVTWVSPSNLTSCWSLITLTFFKYELADKHVKLVKMDNYVRFSNISIFSNLVIRRCIKIEMMIYFADMYVPHWLFCEDHQNSNWK